MISKEPLPWNEHQRDPINSVLLVDARDELTNARKYNQEINEAGNGKEKKKSRIIALKIQERNDCTLSKLSLNKVVSYVLTFHDNKQHI